MISLHPEPGSHKHDWWVYSTAIAQGWLMVECRITGKKGTVRDPSKKEWTDAFTAPSKPYRWTDNSRVTVNE